MESVDIGSLPFQGDYEKLNREARGEEQHYFEKIIVDYYVGKIMAGLDVATYPQLRDMCSMFLDELSGLVKVEGKYAALDSLRPRCKGIAEVDVIFKHSRRIYEKVNKPFKMRVCVTGPYTLSSFLIESNVDQVLDLAEALYQIAEGSIQSNSYGCVEMLAIEEPLLGVVDDPRLDYAGEWSEAFLRAWDKVFYAASSKGVLCSMHLHSTSNKIFWDVDRLNIIEAEADDDIFRAERTRKLLERRDKKLKASICITDVNRLAEKAAEHTPRYSTLPEEQRLGQLWADIKRGKEDATILLESEEEISARLQQTIKLVGLENIPYAGPECGLKSFLTLDNALLYLKRCSDVVRRFG
ncbi:MAG: hypothetical protein QXR91_07010 [Nitrososphaerales archaeon]